MKNKIIIILGITFLTNSLISANSIYKVTADGINIRTDSRVQSESLGQLKEGETVQVLSEKYNWCKIIVPERITCFVSDKYLMKINNTKGKVTGSKLNLRAKPDLYGEIIGKVKKGAILTIVSEKEGWFEVTAYPNIKAWVHKQFLKETDINPVKRKRLLKNTYPDANIPQIKNVTPEQTFDQAAIDSIISKLKIASAEEKLAFNQQLVSLGTKIIPYLDSYIGKEETSTSTTYSIIYVLSEICKDNPSLANRFLSKIDPATPLSAGIYLDIVQNILHPQEGKKPYYYLATKSELLDETIQKDTLKFQNICNLNFKLEKVPTPK